MIIQHIYCQYMYCRYIYGIFIQSSMKIKTPTKPKNTDPTKSKTIALLAKNIKYYRHEQLISQEYLAELAELHRNYIGQVERSEVNISVMNLEAIAQALNVNIIDLLQK
ncbi:MAG: hypothetical protein QG651_918 [Pseudomonadota bacterium]|jgi:DNA-binding XRE family transcriptional regulator|nr:hypothetical protein [Pseudomonadota bacterium]